jgi:hypothetical protein
MGWQLGVLTTSPDLSVEWLCRGSNRRPSPVDVVAELTQVVTDSDDVLGSRFDLPPRPDVPQYACLELLDQHPGVSSAELARGGQSTQVRSSKP